MRSSVIISKRGDIYIADVSGKFGGGYSGPTAGKTPEEAAAFACREMIRYAQGNKDGGDLIAPSEVMELVPEHLRSISARDDNIKAITIKNIDPELFHRFKVACATNQIGMRQAVLNFMENYAKETAKYRPK